MPDGGEPPAEYAARVLEWQAFVCERMGSPFYAGLLPFLAADARAGGPVAELLAGYFTEPVSSAVPLRLLGAAHALALTGAADDLAACYAAAAQPGSRPAAAWEVLRPVLADGRHRAHFADWLTRPPQTNEVGRGAALVGGLAHVAAEAALPVRLVEIGASAGLNLRADQFRISGDVGSRGPATSPVVLAGAWLGAAPPDAGVQVIERTGGDLDPVDPLSPGGGLLLHAYLWPDQEHRRILLRGAIAIAASVPAELRRESATATLARTRLADGTWTVLWHSTMREYLSGQQKAELADGVAALGAAATPSARFAYLHLEPPPEPGPFRVTLTTWPGGRERILGTASPHGSPVTWTAA